MPPSGKTDLLLGTLDLLVLKVLDLGPLHGLGRRPPDRAGDAGRLPGQARLALSGALPHGAGRLAAVVVGPLGDEPPGPLLPPDGGRPTPARRRDRTVGAGVDRDDAGPASPPNRLECAMEAMGVGSFGSSAASSVAARSTETWTPKSRATCEMLADEKMASGMAAGRSVPSGQARDGRRGAGERGRCGRAAGRLARHASHATSASASARLAKAPTFSVTVVLVLALGIGANVAVFGLVNLLLLQPRVGSGQPGELVALHVHDPGSPASYRRFSYAEYEELRRQCPGVQPPRGVPQPQRAALERRGVAERGRRAGHGVLLPRRSVCVSSPAAPSRRRKSARAAEPRSR